MECIMNRGATHERRWISTGLEFEPDILAVHTFAEVHRKKTLEPEQKLVLAVLTDAIDCFQKNVDAKSFRARKLFKDTERWICSRDSSWPYSFDRVCDVLNINPSYLRSGLLQWRVDYESKRNGRNGRRRSLRYQHRVKHSRMCV